MSACGSTSLARALVLISPHRTRCDVPHVLRLRSWSVVAFSPVARACTSSHAEGPALYAISDSRRSSLLQRFLPKRSRRGRGASYTSGLFVCLSPVSALDQALANSGLAKRVGASAEAYHEAMLKYASSEAFEAAPKS